MQAVWETLFGGLRALFFYCFDFVVGAGTNLITGILGVITAAVPSSLAGVVGTFSVYMEIANSWVPLDFAIAMIVAYYTVAMSVYSIRHVIKLIPTVG